MAKQLPVFGYLLQQRLTSRHRKSHSCSVAAITNYHTLVGLTQHKCVFLPLCRLAAHLSLTRMKSEALGGSPFTCFVQPPEAPSSWARGPLSPSPKLSCHSLQSRLLLTLTPAGRELTELDRSRLDNQANLPIPRTILWVTSAKFLREVTYWQISGIRVWVPLFHLLHHLKWFF